MGLETVVFSSKGSGEGDYIYLHDLSLENINKGIRPASSTAVFLMFGNNSDYDTFYNIIRS